MFFNLSAHVLELQNLLIRERLPILPLRLNLRSFVPPSCEANTARFLVDIFLAITLPLRTRRRFPDDSLKGFGGNTKAIWNACSFNLGDFPQVRAFTANHRDFCLVDVLKTKHTGTHTFTSFDNRRHNTIRLKAGMRGQGSYP